MLCGCTAVVKETETDLSDWRTVDFFTDESLVEDPYPTSTSSARRSRVLPLPNLGVVAVTGHDEVSDVYLDTESFSSCNSVVGRYARTH